MFYIVVLVVGLNLWSTDRPDLAVAHIPDSLQQDAWAVIRSYHRTLGIESPREYSENVEAAITIFDKRSHHDILKVDYDKYSTARIRDVVIYDANGVLVRKIKNSEIEDVSNYNGDYDAVRYLLLDLRHNSYPYTITYTFKREFSQTMNYGRWYPTEGYYTSLESASLRLSSPVDMHVHVIARNADFVHSENIEGKDRVRAWHVAGLPAIAYEEDSPPWYETLPILVISPETFEVEEYQGSMSDWQAFGRFIYEINEDKDLVSGTLSRNVQELVSSAQDEKEKIAILYDYLQQNTRYVSVQLGLGGWQSFGALYVETFGFGDCKALTYFMKGILKEVGIESYPALIHSGEDNFFVEEFAAPGVFNHVILYVPDHEMWLECTNNLLPAGQLGESCMDKEVLFITPEGGKRSKTPAFDSCYGVQTTDSLFLHKGEWYLSGNLRATGAKHDYWRYMASPMVTQPKREQQFREWIDAPVAEIVDLEYSASEELPEAGLAYAVRLSHFGSKAGSRLFVPAIPQRRFSKECRRSKRRMDAMLRDPTNTESAFVLTIPDGYQVEILPENISIVEEGIGEYALALEGTDGHIVVTRRLIMYRTRVKASEYSRLCDFYKAIRRADRSTISLLAN